jgi:hypothetical protein
MRKLLISLTAVAALMFTGAAAYAQNGNIGPYECLIGGADGVNPSSAVDNCVIALEGQGDCSGYAGATLTSASHLSSCGLSMNGKLHFDIKDASGLTTPDAFGNRFDFLKVHGQLDMTIEASSATSYFCSSWVRGGCIIEGDADHAKCFFSFEPGYHDFEPQLCNGAFTIEAQRFDDSKFSFLITGISQISPLGVTNGKYLPNVVSVGSTNLKGLSNVFFPYLVKID